ncbi:MAG TPA: 3-hydroxyacyl-CoA dehydrogenase NAD-binding domain-containing protein [Steroidobacteraceae bacterium]|jgi:3-hydroxyacyl-CoA dehydrogenase|nr:3-hydroxyacyl-CoA dehydrogenase NAD-binding domain-containing protein [Steroidobacteraceae bacterium]
MAYADYTSQGAVAVITLKNPPVNALSIGLRSAVADLLERATSDESVRAVVIVGSGNAFCGGADVGEFGLPAMSASPSLAGMLALIENSPKPVVAAINGLALGGGLELAMACHYRVAAAAAQLGLPEVKLGILPGAGGTQRLPRLAGVERALNMIISGNPVGARELAKTDLLDSTADGDVLPAAVAFAKRVIAEKLPLKKARDIKIDSPNAQALLDFARGAAAPLAKNYPAPLKCIDAVEAAVLKPFDEGMKIEESFFIELLNTPQSKALRHAFFAMRAAGKIPDVPAGTPLRAIKSVAVIGAGTMGGGIAMNFANAGIPVVVLETTQAALDKGLATIKRNYESTLKKGRLTQDEFDKRLKRIAGALSYDDIKDADLIIEAVFEDMEVKKQVFEKLDIVAKSGAILASNTSTLDLNRIAGFTRRPQDVIGLHFFSPANVSKLLEIVRGAQSAKDVVATSMAVSKQIKKVGVISGVCDGFIGNRMMNAYFRQMELLLDAGALPQQIDKAMENFGFAMGPFRVSDLAGNDILWYIRKRLYVEYPDRVFSKTPDRICELGRFGQKTGAGWYDYKPGDRTPIPSELVNNIVLEESARLGLPPRKVGDDEIVERALYSLINEGARILEEGIALRASDIDVVYLTGYGFPDFRGGPLFYADRVGLTNILRTMREFANGYQPDAWEPAPLLKKLAAEGKTFAGWGNQQSRIDP